MRLPRFGHIVVAPIFLLLLTNIVSGQDYRSAIGIRAGAPTGLSVKGYFDERVSGEFILTFAHGGLQFLALYQLNKPTYWRSPGFSWVTGGGAHVGYFTDRYRGLVETVFWYQDKIPTHATSVFGFSGILGLEYVLIDSPLAFQADIKPVINFFGPAYFTADVLNISVTARYLIKR